jgi:hypothetical protein
MIPTKQNPAANQAHRVRENDQEQRFNREHKESQTYRQIAVVPKTPREEFRIGVRDYNGTVKIEIRVFERDGLGIWQQTPRRLTIGRGPIAAVIAALCECEARL